MSRLIAALLILLLARPDALVGQAAAPASRVAAGAIGAIAGAISYQECTSTEFLGCLFAPESRTDSALLGGVVGGVLGFVAGSLAGLVPREHWKRVTLADRRVAAAVRPGAHGAGLGVSLRF